MKKLVLISIMLFAAIQIFAQTIKSTSVQGQIVDNQTKKPISNHIVYLRDKEIIFDSSLINKDVYHNEIKTVTDSQGMYYFNNLIYPYPKLGSTTTVSTYDCNQNLIEKIVYVNPEIPVQVINFSICNKEIIPILPCKADFIVEKGIDSSIFPGLIGVPTPRTFSFINRSVGNSMVNCICLTYNWNFGDGTTSNQRDVIHEYAKEGNYNVCLTIYDSVNKCKNYLCQNVNVVNTDTLSVCKANFDYNTFEIACIDCPKNHNSFSFSNLSSGNYVKSFWDFGDGTSSIEFNPDHTYSKAGLYNVCLTISGPSCQNSFCKQVIVSINDTIPQQLCKADFSYESMIVCTGISYDSLHKMYNSNFIKFNNLSYVNQPRIINESYWDFGDGTFSYEATPMHSYKSKGIYNVCLTVTNGVDCKDRICKIVVVGDTSVSGCKADFSYESAIVYSGINYDSLYKTYPSTTIRFKNLSQVNEPRIINECYWDFGDGTFSYEATPMHSYKSKGVYNVCLTVTNGVDCKDRICKKVVVGDTSATDCKADFNYNILIPVGSDSSINSPIIVNTCVFNNLSYGNFVKTYWDFGDGSYSYESNPYHNYLKSGIYKVCLSISGANCYNSVCKEILIKLNDTLPVLPCKAKAKFFNELVMTPEQKPSLTRAVRFYNMSTGDYNVSYWNFGDGSYSNEKNPEHLYKEWGLYHVCLTITNGTTCKDQICMDVHIGYSDTILSDCKADFSYESALVYSGINYDSLYKTYNSNLIKFNNLSRINQPRIINECYWDFGDGTFSYESTPMHSYKSKGVYNVCLTVTNGVDCKDRICKIVVVGDTSASECKIDFIISKQLAYKQDPATSSTFNFYSRVDSNKTKVYWSFGDGTYSCEHNPEHTYLKDGNYSVCLKVYNNCNNNTICKEVVAGKDILPPDCKASFRLVKGIDYTTFPGIKRLSTPLTITVTDQSSGNPLLNCMCITYLWDFGDGATSTDINAIHDYIQPGTYQVCLTINDKSNNCSAQYCQYVTVGEEISKPCKADFDINPYSIYSDSINTMYNWYYFTNTSTGNTNNYWSFGDGSVSTDINPSHQYEGASIYNVCLTVKNDNCKDYTCQKIQTGMVFYKLLPLLDTMINDKPSIPESSILDNVTLTIESCVIDYMKSIESVSVKDFQVISDKTVEVNWLIKQNGKEIIITKVIHINLYGLNKLYLTINCNDGIKKSVHSNTFIDIIDIKPLGIHSEQLGKMDFRIYPNPVSDILNIDLNLTTKENIHITLLNQFGQTVYSSEYNGNSGANKLNIDSGSLAEGIYFVQIKDELNNYCTKKFVKIH